MVNRMKRTTYYRGAKGRKWGIWNSQRKEFQFGICEDSPYLAEARLMYMIGDDARKWRFEAKELPKELVEQNKQTEINVEELHRNAKAMNDILFKNYMDFNTVLNNCKIMERILEEVIKGENGEESQVVKFTNISSFAQYIKAMNEVQIDFLARRLEGSK